MYAMFNDVAQLTISLHLKLGLGQADYWLAKILKTAHLIVDDFYKKRKLVAFF